MVIGLLLSGNAYAKDYPMLGDYSWSFTDSTGTEIEVEAENESQAYEITEAKIYSNHHTENFDDLNLLNCEEV